MPTPDDESQLEHTKMSFGEHLEELRSALFKSLVAIGIGFAIGLLLGWDIVKFVQVPLRDGLEAHYKNRVESQELERLEALKAAGADLPDDLEEAAKEFAKQGLVPHEMYIDPNALLAALRAQWPERFDDATWPAAAPDTVVPQKKDLLKIQAYQSLAEDPRMRVVGLGVEEPFVVYVKASLIAGIVIASPFVFFYLWEFVAAGLYRTERSYVYTYLPISIALFLAGAALAFFVAFDFVLDFLFWFFEKTNTDPDPRLSYWITLVLMLPLGFGISFQLPLVMLALERIGIASIEGYLRKWRIAVLVICILSMFLTPADPWSMVIMATPLVALYFGGILLCRYMPGARATSEPAADADS